MEEKETLTAKDIEHIHTLLHVVKNNKKEFSTFTRLEDAQYQEVLDRFNRSKIN